MSVLSEEEKWGKGGISGSLAGDGNAIGAPTRMHLGGPRQQTVGRCAAGGMRTAATPQAMVERGERRGTAPARVPDGCSYKATAGLRRLHRRSTTAGAGGGRCNRVARGGCKDAL